MWADTADTRSHRTQSGDGLAGAAGGRGRHPLASPAPIPYIPPMTDLPDSGFIIAPIPGTGPRPGWMARLSKGLSRSSAQLSEQVVATLTKKKLDQADLDALEEMLIEADLGPEAAARVAERFGQGRFGKEATEAEVRESLAEAIAGEIRHREGRFAPLEGPVGVKLPRPRVVLFVGVNGSGKTTTLGKIAADLTRRGARVLIAAGDTFRAAAIEQLAVWADRAGAPIVSRPAGFDAAATEPWRTVAGRLQAGGLRRRGARLRGGGARPPRGLRRGADRHRRPPAEQGRADGRAGQDRARAEEARPGLPP